jgi:hypothetical protein
LGGSHPADPPRPPPDHPTFAAATNVDGVNIAMMLTLSI